MHGRFTFSFNYPHVAGRATFVEGRMAVKSPGWGSKQLLLLLVVSNDWAERADHMLAG